ncbi:GNAT family N-acetyltransferase [Draconibacterium sp.]|jgi:GNAT superfamily N-acetyltransferase
MQVRKATAEDIASIVDFQLKMAAETEGIQLDEATVFKGVSAVVEDSGKGQYYVTEINEKLVASLLTTFEWSDWRNGTILWIQSVYVLKEYRRKGVYRNMYSHIKNLVLENEKLNGIRLYADKSNTPAHKTYQELGMNHDHYVTFEWLK